MALKEAFVDTPQGKEVFLKILDAKQTDKGVVIKHYGDRKELVKHGILLETQEL